MWINLAAAAAYFYFNWRYFALVNISQQRPKYAIFRVTGAFLLNYAMFYLCSTLEWNLLINWGLFFIVQFGETVLYCRGGWRVPLCLSLNGILYGLTVNIFCRCVVAIILSKPLAAFDNHTMAYGNLKWLPVFLGFLLGGAVLHVMSTERAMEKFRVLIAHPKHLDFQLELLAGMFLYLFLNLLLYQSSGNNVLLKLWGIKSVIFSLVGSYLGLCYALKMCELSDYREQNRRIRQELLQSEREGVQLSAMAYKDMLTGLFSRQYALDQLERLLQQRIPFTLCYLDLDDLKGVNDRFGHAEGDRYLATVAGELIRACRTGVDVPARYGGDEFLLLFPGAGVDVVEERIRQVESRLAELCSRGAVTFPMSISHGTVDGSGCSDADAVLAAADEKMYQEKKEKINKQESDAAL